MATDQPHKLGRAESYMCSRISSDPSPGTLYSACLSYLVNHIEQTLATYEPDADRFRLRDDLTLPPLVCENLLRECADSGYVIDDKFMNLFVDTQRTRLKRVNVADSHITDKSLEFLMRHKPHELNVTGCTSLTGNAVNFINADGDRLVALFLGTAAANVLGGAMQRITQLNNHTDSNSDDDDVARDVTTTTHAEPVIACPQLRALSVTRLREDHPSEDNQVSSFFTVLFKPFARLSYLDINHCDVGDFDFLEQLPNLTSLILSDVTIYDLRETFEAIKKLEQLRVLDLSQDKENGHYVHYENPENNMKFLMTGLPHLERLDLSGTNLAGFQPPKEVVHKLTPELPAEDEESAIPGLEGRHLSFLGLLNCPYEASHRLEIPASQITGDANEAQVVLAVKTYKTRADLLLKSLNNMFGVFKYSSCDNQIDALQAIIVAMKHHLFERTIQISGSASLFYIVKGCNKDQLTSAHKKTIVKIILDGMDHHMDEATMLRNGCLTLCHLKIPQDVIFEYERMVTILLKVVKPPQPEEFIQRIGIYLLNSLACQVDGKEKQLVGDLGAITTMLDIIRYKLDQEQCDEVMEIAWSTMWNVTDETPVNCQRFIDGGGMEKFMACLEKFPNKSELLRNMMGLLGNIAEVPYLRCRLIEPDYITVFSDLLKSDSDGIEVSYNACGVLAHIVSDGAAAWTIQLPTRQSVLANMVDAINKWKLNTRRNINYRSFEPILRLLPNYETPEAQHWATWALCNLTKMYRSKYCPLLEREGGMPLLRDMVDHPRPYPTIKQLAGQVIARCDKFREDPDYHSDGELPIEDDEVMDALEG